MFPEIWRTPAFIALLQPIGRLWLSFLIHNCCHDVITLHDAPHSAIMNV
jgi:hypothetical protein